MKEIILVDLCQCGCGLPAPIAKESNARYGHVAGRSIRFRRGHNSRLRPITAGGYAALFRPGHPSADAHGRVMEHVLVAESALGRPLPTGVEVHHVDEDRQNNRNRNLVICQDRAYHQLLHVRARIVRAGGNPDTQKICSGCGLVLDLSAFTVERRNKSTARRAHCRSCVKARWAR